MPFIPDPDERPAEPSGVDLAIYLLVAESVQKTTGTNPSASQKAKSVRAFYDYLATSEFKEGFSKFLESRLS